MPVDHRLTMTHPALTLAGTTQLVGNAGLGMGQILAAWLGQGAYYAALLIGGYVAYRTLLVPPIGISGGLPVRVVRLLQHGTGVALFSAALAAAGLLPPWSSMPCLTWRAATRAPRRALVGCTRRTGRCWRGPAYDASHLGRYDVYVAALNGHSQNYHDAEVFREGLKSPLFDLLHVRYVLVPVQGDHDPADASALERLPMAVYEDGQVKILENPSALPRAWIVHAATRVGTGDALALIATGQIATRRTALLEDAPPPLATPADPSGDQARMTNDDADHLTLRTSTGAPGLLVLREVHYPGWHVYVDGRPVPRYVADHVLRAVPVPPGEHAVELRFASATLATGSFISAMAVVLLATFWAVVPVTRGRAACHQTHL